MTEWPIAEWLTPPSILLGLFRCYLVCLAICVLWTAFALGAVSVAERLVCADGVLLPGCSGPALRFAGPELKP